MMVGTSFFAGLYADPKFLEAMNKNYTKEAMGPSKSKLKTHGFDFVTMEWGEYQDILTPKENWPGNTHQHWQESLREARESLASQRNYETVSPTDTHKPRTKCDLADAVIRKCFNADPPIPIVVNVTKKDALDADPTSHDVLIDWPQTATGETSLKFTIVCPCEESANALRPHQVEREAIERLLRGSLDAIFGQRPATASVQFFKNGIDLIDVGVKIGPAVSPIDFRLKLAGPDARLHLEGP
jgi:hypothetical protein